MYIKIYFKKNKDNQKKQMYNNSLEGIFIKSQQIAKNKI